MSWILAAWIVAGGLTYKNAKWGLTLVGFLGALVSVYLATQHYSDAPALCDAGNLYSCSTVNKSQFSEIAGFPIALLGFGHFLTMLVLANLQNEQSEEYASAGKFLFFTSIISVIYSFVLGYLSAVEIGSWCLFCISLYGLNAIGLFGSWKMKSTHSDVGVFAGKSLATGATSFFAAAVVSFWIVSPAEVQSNETAVILEEPPGR